MTSKLKPFLIILFFCTFHASATDLYPIKDLRKDSVRLLHTHLDMNLRNISSKSFTAVAEITLISKLNGLKTVTLDLEKLGVDSLFHNNVVCPFTVGSNKVICVLPISVNKNDTIRLRVHYSGSPGTDASGFGGFYFSGDYAYVMGVGFQADPHPFGRSWFPCFDNFVMKGTFSYTIVTDTGFAAICGGNLVSKINKDSTITWHYTLNQPIPSYLASVSVSRYELLQGTMQSMQGEIPYILAAQAGDTQNLKASFKNFNGAVEAFVNYFGPYYWDRLGYNCVPFNGGAMEHACNISYPLFAIDGTVNREDLMAHELAHHWWGNNVTCKTQEDMWINEGWASYSEKLFNEFVYGKDRFREKVEETHRNVLQFAHIVDGSILPVSGIGHQHTYGRHVYSKGAGVAHTLRGYMGDEAFFKAIKHIMSSNKFGNIDSKELIDSFQKFTPINLKSFYDGWVVGKGFPHLSIKTWNTKKEGSSYKTSVGILQRNRWDGTPHELIPVEVQLMKADFTTVTKQVMATKYQSNFEFTTDFEPVWVGVDLDNKLADATTDTFRTITQTGTYNFVDGLMEIEVNSIDKPTFVHITHNWLAADNSTQMEPLPVLSRDRFWTVSGTLDEGFSAKGHINYNGRTTSTSGENFLDNQLIRGTEDSLVVMYRPDMFSPWVMADAARATGPTKFDRVGSFMINDLKVGEYALAMFNNSLGSYGLAANTSEITIYPNPAKETVHLNFMSFSQPGFIIITDSTGKIIMKKPIRNTQNNLDLDVSEWASGNYAIILQYPEGQSTKASFVVTK